MYTDKYTINIWRYMIMILLYVLGAILLFAIWLLGMAGCVRERYGSETDFKVAVSWSIISVLYIFLGYILLI